MIAVCHFEKWKPIISRKTMSNTKEEKGVKIETKLKQLFKCRCAATIAVCQLFVVHSMCKVEIQKSITSLQNVFHILIHYMQAIILYMQAKSLYMQAIFLYAKKNKVYLPFAEHLMFKVSKGIQKSITSL